MTTATSSMTPRKKKTFIFYRRLSHMPRSVHCVHRSQNLPKLNIKKCTENNNARAKLLLCSLHLLFCGWICNNSGQIQMEIRKNRRRRSPSSDYAERGHFTFLFCRGCERNGTRIITLVHSYCSLNLLFCDVLVSVTVVGYLNSLR